MSGLMGNVKSTASDLVIVKVLEDKNLVLVKGAIPGAANGLVLIKGSVKDVKKYVVPRQIKEVESKNPMKASKKGAPAPPPRPRSKVPPAGRRQHLSRLRDPHQRHDAFFKKARGAGFAARSVYKLEEIDRRMRLLRAGDRVLDLGCRPGLVDAVRAAGGRAARRRRRHRP